MTAIAAAPERNRDPFHVSPSVDWLGRISEHRRRLMIRLAEFESKALATHINDLPIEQPIYIAGFARSGTTVLLELLSSLDGMASHRYSDFPFVFTPYWWGWFLARMRRGTGQAVERAHGDGLMVTPESPEAMEEPLWMAFFADAHDPGRSNVVAAATDHAVFESFYRNHIRKLLLIRRGRRYISKGNYNLTRLEYLLKLFPDARLVVPVREPASHVASLIRQQALFAGGQTRNPRAVNYLRRVGHFEFGLGRRPINADDTRCIAGISALWESGEEVRGWARYWSHIYGYLADRLEASDRLRQAVTVVRFEDLCLAPRQTLERVLGHCRLDPDQPTLDRLTKGISLPTKYSPTFAQQDLDVIQTETRDVAHRFGY